MGVIGDAWTLLLPLQLLERFPLIAVFGFVVRGNDPPGVAMPDLESASVHPHISRPVSCLQAYHCEFHCLPVVMWAMTGMFGNYFVSARESQRPTASSPRCVRPEHALVAILSSPPGRRLPQLISLSLSLQHTSDVRSRSASAPSLRGYQSGGYPAPSI